MAKFKGLCKFDNSVYTSYIKEDRAVIDVLHGDLKAYPKV